jgi:hypothetical protein
VEEWETSKSTDNCLGKDGWVEAAWVGHVPLEMVSFERANISISSSYVVIAHRTDFQTG